LLKAKAESKAKGAGSILASASALALAFDIATAEPLQKISIPIFWRRHSNLSIIGELAVMQGN
jgi:hypothetical protein